MINLNLFVILSHKGNVNENYFNIPYSSSQNGLNQEIKLTKTGANVEK